MGGNLGPWSAIRRRWWFGLACELGMTNLILKSDYPLLVAKICSYKTCVKDLSLLGHNVHLLGHVVSSSSVIRMQYRGRRHNVPAHLLAQYTYWLNRGWNWVLFLKLKKKKNIYYFIPIKRISLMSLY